MKEELNLIFSNNVINIILLIILSIATYTDIKYKKIYNKFNIFLIIMRIALSIPIFKYSLNMNYILGGIVGFLLLFIPAFITMLNMGGDIKFVGVIGLYLGFPVIIPFLFLSCGYGLLYVLIRKVLIKDKLLTKKSLFPFAPCFLCSYVTLYLINLVC